MRWDAGTYGPHLMQSPAGSDARTVFGRDTGGVVGLAATTSAVDADVVGLTWATSTAAPTEFALGVVQPVAGQVRAINSSGAMVGAGLVPVQYWPAPQASPIALALPAGADAPPSLDDLGDDGMITGHVSVAGTVRPLAWVDKAATPVVLDLPAGLVGLASSSTHTAPTVYASSSGLVAATAVDSSNVPHGVFWSTPSASPATLVAPTGYSSVSVAGVTTAGAVVGFAKNDSTLAWSAFVWTTAAATPVLLAAPTGMHVTSVSYVAGSGAMVGTALDGSSVAHGVVWASPTAPATLLAGLPGYTVPSQPSGVSNAGVVVAYADDATFLRSLARWPVPTNPPALVASPPGVHPWLIEAVSDAGSVVVEPYGSHVWVYTP